MAGMLLGTRAGFIATTTAIGTLVTLGYLETHGIVESDITWRFTQLEFKDAVEDSFIFAMIAVVSWLSNREIASSLVLSEHTVHRHVANILRKLGQSSRAAAAAQATRAGFI